MIADQIARSNFMVSIVNLQDRLEEGRPQAKAYRQPPSHAQKRLQLVSTIKLGRTPGVDMA